MASKTLITITDDVTGEQADETVSFALDGVEYEIDLTEDNAISLRQSLDNFINHGRRIGKAGRGAVTATSSRSSAPRTPSKLTMLDRRNIQAFAVQHDLKVPGDRGRIAGDVMEAWIAAGRPQSA